LSGPYDPSDPHAKGRKLASYAAAWQAAVSLRPGAVAIYHTHGDPHDPGTMAAWWDAYDQGLVTLAARGGRCAGIHGHEKDAAVMSERCETCRFWRNIVNLRHGAEGDCRRYPAKDTRAWAHDWCGEWQAKAQEPGKPKERAPGWYWVRLDRMPDGGPINPGYEWMPCECLGGDHWYLRCGLESRRITGDGLFGKIDERRIERQPPDHCLGPKL
jgi:hypothetical protein